MLTPETSVQRKVSQEDSFSETALKDGGGLLKVFLQAWKNFGLYPEGHVTSNKSLQSLQYAFDEFLAKYGTFRLVVENNRLLWRDSVLHEIQPGTSADDLIFPLYRDGINWIEFQEGLPLEEISSFFTILKKYNSLQEEPDGDIVTELIDEDLSFIEFKAVDILWEDHPLLDFATLPNPAAETGQVFSPDTAKETEEQQSDASREVSSANTSATETSLEGPQNDAAGLAQQKKITQPESFIKSISDPSYNEALWEISPDENDLLQEMIQQEENWDNAEDVFDVLLAILRSQTDKLNFSAVLDFTLEEVGETIEQEEFGSLLNLFQALHQMLYKDISAEYIWIRPLLQRFFQDLSRPETFNIICSKLLTLNDNDTEKIRNLRQVLLYFSPDVILLLGPVILQTRSPEVLKMILEVSEHLCLRDISPLEKILEDRDQKLGEAILPILGLLKGERAEMIFLKMVEHPSEKVRAKAVKNLVSRDPKIVSKLFFLIDDPCAEVSTILLAAIARQKSAALENLLLRYMKESLDQKPPEHILACYETLSSCGSTTAFQFLKRILLNQGWNSFTGFGKELHRQGAATALALMDTREAKDILLEASESKYPVIRQAFQAATVRIDALRGKNDA